MSKDLKHRDIIEDYWDAFEVHKFLGNGFQTD